MLFIASQEYAPWSISEAIGHVSSPKARLSPTSSLVIEHLSGTCPQFRRQTTWGVGMPIAVQLMMKVKL